MASVSIDHLLFATASLEQGMDEIEALLGVRPVPGGHHPNYGTHNALLSLGVGIYLEVIARDPRLPEPDAGAFVDFANESKSRLITWVARTDCIHEDANKANLAGAGLGPILSGSRKAPDGSDVSWEVTNPYAMPFDGAIPFLISWGDTTHPSRVTPVAGSLVQLQIDHPEPDRIQQVLGALEVPVLVKSAEQFHLTATIETENGSVILR